jgi:hypothetical protein
MNEQLDRTLSPVEITEPRLAERADDTHGIGSKSI